MAKHKMKLRKPTKLTRCISAIKSRQAKRRKR